MKRMIAVWLLLVPLAPASAQVVFPVSFAPSAVGLTETERNNLTSHFQAAGAQWVALMDIEGSRSIEIQIALDDNIATANGASATSSFVGNESGRNTFEMGAAAELRTGVDPNGVDPDILINFSTVYLRNELWFDPNPYQRIFPVDSQRTDAMSVALHELGHALAYNGWANGQGVPPETYWSTFDRWMQPGTPTLFEGPDTVQTWGSAPDLTTNNIHHWSNDSIPPRPAARSQPILWKGGAPVPLPACDGVPSQDAPVSADRGSLPPGLLYELMNGVVFFRGSRYDISPLDVSALTDAGLPMRVPSLFANGFEDID